MSLTGDELKTKLATYIGDRQKEIEQIQFSAKQETARIQGQIDAAVEAAKLWTPDVSKLIAFLQQAGIKVVD